MKQIIYIVFVVLVLWFPINISAHEVRPAYLEITENSKHELTVIWKQPIMGEVAIRLVPHLSSGILESSQPNVSITSSFLIKYWTKINNSKNPLYGQHIIIEGLESTITDVLVNIHFANEKSIQHIIKPNQPSFQIGFESKNGISVPAYLILGIEHILAGFDHLLFVLGLLLLVKGKLRLFKTITSFTIAHSITLAFAALGIVSIQPPVVESVIALSIIFLALELTRSYQGLNSITIRYPWLIAFSFGLLHGFGFAGALANVGLPKDAIPL